MNTEELIAVAFPLANRFFKANDHKGKVRGNERVFILRDEQQKIVAALRACPKKEGFLLRSVQVDVQLFGKGLGTRLIKDTLSLLAPASCWCYPYEHLQHFYQQCGFSCCTRDQVNPDIGDPYQNYLNRGQRLLLMVSIPKVTGEAATPESSSTAGK